jgi:hypothetical protein
MLKFSTKGERGSYEDSLILQGEREDGDVP